MGCFVAMSLWLYLWPSLLPLSLLLGGWGEGVPGNAEEEEDKDEDDDETIACSGSTAMTTTAAAAAQEL
jgi:hypothetical protein